jgi:hypothetical protein
MPASGLDWRREKAYDLKEMETFFSQNLYLILLIILWSLPWKGVALWKAVELRDKTWFVALLVLNTIGILDIFYIYKIARRKDLLERAFSS